MPKMVYEFFQAFEIFRWWRQLICSHCMSKNPELYEQWKNAHYKSPVCLKKDTTFIIKYLWLSLMYQASKRNPPRNPDRSANMSHINIVIMRHYMHITLSVFWRVCLFLLVNMLNYCDADIYSPIHTMCNYIRVDKGQGE